jgi:hypothetical protein
MASRALAALGLECRETVAREKARLRGWRAARPVLLRTEYAERPEFQAMHHEGRKRLEAFERALEFLYTEGGVKLGYLQVRFMRAIRDACLKRMFGDQLLTNLEWLRETRGVVSLEAAVSIVFPRRVGKTTVQCLAAAALAVSQPDGNVVCFNLFGRQSEAWLKQTMIYLEILQRSPEFAWTEVDRHMPERISIRSAMARTVNTISSYPGGQAGSYDNKRGMGFKLCAGFFDEAGFFPEDAMPSLLPIFANGAALIMGTSVGKGGPRAGIMKILDAKDATGKSVIREENYVRGCGACRAKGAADRCAHIVPRPQHFQRRSDQARLQALMAPFEGAFERELLNIQDRPLISAAFEPALLKPLDNVARDVSLFQRDHPLIVMALDPNGGGMSQACLVTATQVPSANGGVPQLVVRSSSSFSMGSAGGSAGSSRSMPQSHTRRAQSTKSARIAAGAGACTSSSMSR